MSEVYKDLTELYVGEVAKGSCRIHFRGAGYPHFRCD